MTLTISDTTMTSDQTVHTARHAPERGGCEVSWLPGRTLDRNTAITAMTLADTTAGQDLHATHQLWPHIQGWAEELGLTAPQAIARICHPSGGTSRQQEQRPPSRTAKQPTEQRMASIPAGPARLSDQQIAAVPKKRRMTDVRDR